jgi:hypothetical protein
MKIDNIKEEVTHDIENLRKKNETEIQNIIEGHSSRLQQAEDTISELNIKWKLKEKQKSYKTNNSRPVKGICKNSTTPSKDQTLESWALKKEKCKQKAFKEYSTKS